MRLRTYAVLCMNEECGLLEWVNNTSCELFEYGATLLFHCVCLFNLLGLRHLIIAAHEFWPDEYPMISGTDIHTAFVQMQSK